MSAVQKQRQGIHDSGQDQVAAASKPKRDSASCLIVKQRCDKQGSVFLHCSGCDVRQCVCVQALSQSPVAKSFIFFTEVCALIIV